MDVDVFDEDVDGCIESIHVRNFFCHDNMEVNFNRNLNFIVGRNGSGKSAIVTALVVGLGSRASATNRGNSLSCKSSVLCLSLRSILNFLVSFSQKLVLREKLMNTKSVYLEINPK